VGPIAIRRSTRRLRRHLAGLVLLAALGTAIAGHHTGLTAPDMHHDGMGAAAVEMCLGALTAVGATVAAVAIGVLALGRWPTVAEPGGAAVALAGARAPEARAGPPPLAQLCVWRR
jgi:hypothetical protein